MSTRLVAVLLALPAAAAGQYQGVAGPSTLQHGQFGQRVAAIPDVDGDAITDVAAAANDQLHGPAILPGPDQGRVFLYSGRTGAFLRVIHPTQTGTGFGAAIAGMPDLNGDGRGEIAIGAPDVPGPGVGAGRVFVFSGATGQWLRTFTCPPAGLHLRFGHALSPIGDLDGDGRADLVVGAPVGGIRTIWSMNMGRVFVVSGESGTVIREFRSPIVHPDGGVGWSVAGFPDLNGDGRPEIGMGADERVYVFSGATGGLIRVLIGPSNALAFGVSLAWTPDANGDGRADIIVGAPLSDVNHGPMLPAFAPEAGRAYLYSGATGALLRTFTSPRIGFNHFGWSVSGAPDMNGDGRGEVVIGAPLNVDQEYGQGYGPGRVYVFSGGTGALYKSYASPNPQDDGRFGISVVGLPDTNANGRADLFIGAPYEDPTGQVFQDRGRAYFIRQ